MTPKREGKPMRWLREHASYPHEDWCLIWPFTRDRREGRATMCFAGKHTLAHRVMCELAHGPQPSDKPQVSHRCGNGHLACVNPHHLCWASNGENQIQRYAHGRPNKSANGNRSQFSPETIEKMRAQWGEFTQERLAQMYGVSIPTIQYYLKYRETRGHASGKVRHWAPEEDERLREAISRGYNFRQSAEFVGRPQGATVSRAYRLGLKSGVPPTPRNALQ